MEENTTIQLVGATVEKLIWKQTYREKSGKLVIQEINMEEMSEEHLQKALYKCELKLFELQEQMNGWTDLLFKIEKVAVGKNYQLEDVNVDDIVNSARIKHYHKCRRQVRYNK